MAFPGDKLGTSSPTERARRLARELETAKKDLFELRQVVERSTGYRDDVTGMEQLVVSLRRELLELHQGSAAEVWKHVLLSGANQADEKPNTLPTHRFEREEIVGLWVAGLVTLAFLVWTLIVH